MAENEKTSPDIASIGAYVLGLDDDELAAYAISHPHDLRSLAASALTQAEDRAKESGSPL